MGRNKGIKVVSILVISILTLLVVVFMVQNKGKFNNKVGNTVEAIVNLGSTGYKNLESLKGDISKNLYDELVRNKVILESYNVESGIDITSYVSNLVEAWETVDEYGNKVVIDYGVDLDYKIYKDGDRYYLDTSYLLSDKDIQQQVIDNGGKLKVLVGDYSIDIDIPEYYVLKANESLASSYSVVDIEELLSKGGSGLYRVTLEELKSRDVIEDSVFGEGEVIEDDGSKRLISVDVSTINNKIVSINEV